MPMVSGNVSETIAPCFHRDTENTQISHVVNSEIIYATAPTVEVRFLYTAKPVCRTIYKSVT